jgi:hypothetical protein
MDMFNRWSALFRRCGAVWLAVLAGPAAAQLFEPGQTYFGRSNYIEYIAGNLPVIIAAPHGGSLKPAELPDRTYGTTSIDANTESLTREVFTAFTNRLGPGAWPHVIICRLHREKIDCNRDIVEGAQGHPLTEIAWNEFQNFILAAKHTVTNHFGRGLFLDIHGHGHTFQRLELGYLLGTNTLNLSDASLNSGSAANNSSIRHLNTLSPFTFAQLLRGTNSLGGLLESLGYPAVPGPTYPNPGGYDYFNGGYNTAEHGSRFHGTISAIQIECNFTNIRDSALNRRLFATNLAAATAAYFSNHFALNLHDRLPAISPLADRVTDEDTATGPIAFTVTDDVTPPASLALSRESSDPALVPLSRITLGGAGSNRTVSVLPATNQFGAAFITLRVADANGGTNACVFQLTVQPVNDPPTLAPLSNRTVAAGLTLTLTNQAADVDPGDTLTFSLLTAPAGAALDATNGVLTWRPPAAAADSTNLFHVRVADNGTPSLAATQQLLVTVPPLALPLVSPALLPDGRVQLGISGDPGPDYTVQASGNLNTWTNLFSTNAPELPFQWTDPGASGLTSRFYRVLLGP